MTIRCFARRWRARRLHRDVHLAIGRLRGESPPELVEVGPDDGQLIAVHGVRGQADDPLDVAAALGDRATHVLEGARIDVGCEDRDQVPVGHPRHLGFHQWFDCDLHPGRPEGVGQRGAEAWRHRCCERNFDAKEKASVDADLLDVLHCDLLVRQGRKEPGGDAGPVLPTHRHQVRSGLAVLGHDSVRSSFRLTQPACPRPSAAPLRAGTPATTQRVRHHAADHGSSRHDDVLADLGARQDDAGVQAEAESGPEPMRTPASVGHWRPIWLDRIEIRVVLIGDVHVRAGLDVAVADDDLPMTDDVRAVLDEATLADRHHRVGRR